MENLLTIEQSAKKLTLSPWTLRKWIAAGRLPAIRLGRRLAIEERVLCQLVEQSRGGERPVTALPPAS